MKRKWLYVLLVISLAVHAGVLGSYVVRKYREWRWSERYWRSSLKSRAALKSVDSLFKGYADDRDSLRRPYWESRRELGRLAFEPSPDSARVESLIARLAAVDRRVNIQMFRLLFGLRALRRPEVVEKWRLRAIADADSARRADSIWYAGRAAYRARVKVGGVK